MVDGRGIGAHEGEEERLARWERGLIDGSTWIQRNGKWSRSQREDREKERGREDRERERIERQREMSKRWRVRDYPDDDSSRKTATSATAK